MTQIRANLGGAASSSNDPGVGAAAPGGQSERWRDKFHDYGGLQNPVDWTDPQYATPKPAPKTIYGRRVQVKVNVPELPQAMIRVRAKPPATYYDIEGNPISDQWTIVPISSGLVQAIKDGDVERDMTYKQEKQQASPPPQQSRRHHAQVPHDSAKT